MACFFGVNTSGGCDGSVTAVACARRVAGAALTAYFQGAEALVVMVSDLRVIAVLQWAATVSSTVAWSQALEAAVLRRLPPLVSLHSCSGVFLCIHCSNADVNRKCALNVVGYDAAEMIEPEM